MVILTRNILTVFTVPQKLLNCKYSVCQILYQHSNFPFKKMKTSVLKRFCQLTSDSNLKSDVSVLTDYYFYPQKIR